MATDESFLKKRALQLWDEGQQHHLKGEIEKAIDLYSKSIDVFPTAEAYTFRGWAYSSEDRIDEAICECEKAIDCDPSYGMPYNDIGSYLVRMGKGDEAIEWFERAKRAERYEPRHFPYMNLGRLFAQKGMVIRAIKEFEGALAVCPGEPHCLAALAQLRRELN